MRGGMPLMMVVGGWMAEWLDGLAVTLRAAMAVDNWPLIIDN